jgi:hypothetical protein
MTGGKSKRSGCPFVFFANQQQHSIRIHSNAGRKDATGGED